MTNGDGVRTRRCERGPVQHYPRRSTRTRRARRRAGSDLYWHATWRTRRITATIRSPQCRRILRPKPHPRHAPFWSALCRPHNSDKTGWSGPHKCNTTTIQLQYKNFFLVSQLYCACADRLCARSPSRVQLHGTHCRPTFVEPKESYTY